MKQIARWTALIALFTIPFIPLYVANDLFFPFITGKAFAFRILVEVAFGAYVLLACFDKRYRPQFSWILASFALLVGWMAFADLLGVYPHKAFWSNFERMDGWVTLVHMFLLFVTTSALLTVDKLWRRWWLFFVSVAALLCCFGLIQLSGGAEIHQGGVRVDSTFGNAIYFAVYLLFAMLIATWLAIESKGWVRYALLAFLPLAGFLLFFTASRGPLIGLIGGAIAAAVLWLFLARKEWNKGSGALGFKIAVGAIIGVVVLTGALFLARNTAFVQNQQILSRVASVFSLNKELTVRSTIWGIALEGIAEDPLTGWGQEGFNQIFNKYYKPSLYSQESWFDRAHNMYLDWTVAGGIPALLLFIALLVLGFFALLRMPGASRAERVLCAGALIAYGIQAIVVFDNLFSYIPFVLLLAMAHGRMARPVAYVQSLPEVRSETGEAVSGAVGLIVTVVVVWVVNVPNIAAANHLIYAISPSPSLETNLSYFDRALTDGSFGTQEICEQLVSLAGQIVGDTRIPESVRIAFVTKAVSEMEKEVLQNPNDARLRSQLSAAYETAGDMNAAIRENNTAIALSPNKQTLYMMQGYRFIQLERFKEAKQLFQKAYDLDPSFDQVSIATAAGYILAGDLKAGKQLLIQDVGTTTPDSDALYYAYYRTSQWPEMIGVAQARIALADSVESRLRVLRAFVAAGRIAEARAYVTELVARYPEAWNAAEAVLTPQSVNQ